MHRNALAAVAVASVALVGSTALLTIAGPVDPPEGPVASTYKTLTEVEPRTPISLATTPGDEDSLFKITQPGSYYLTANVDGVADFRAIEIDASRVTIDLMGFTLQGVPGSLEGIATTANFDDLAVRRGTVAGFGGAGVDLARAGSGIGAVVEGVHATSNGEAGIRAGSHAAVRDCTATLNAGDGIVVGAGATVSGCVASANSGDGLSAGDTCTIAACTATANVGRGIVAGAGGSITASTAASNASSGIVAGNGCLIAGCVARSNALDGVQVLSASVVRDNLCTNNGATGLGFNVHAVGTDNRVEGNTCVGADRGISVAVAGNIIVRNTCTGNAINYLIVADNVYGPIIDRRMPASPGVNGSAAASTLATTDANANFAY